MKPLRILIVDDASFTRDLIRKSVRHFFPSFPCDEAHDGEAAQKLLLKNEYDLILSDWEMPKMTGSELLVWVREQEKTANIPFVMVTSRGDKDHVVEALKLKVSNYLVKPFSNDKFGKVVSGVIMKAYSLTQDELVRLSGSTQGARLTGGARGGFSEALQISSDIGKPKEERGAHELVLRPKGKLLIPIRTGKGSQTHILVRELSCTQLLGVIKAGEMVPHIQEQVVIDVQAAGAVARINGYIHLLECREGGAAADFLNITIVNVDQNDESKRKQLEAYIKENG